MASSTAAWSGKSRYALAALRIALGLVFLWAFFDKAFGLTYTTPAGAGWFGEGGSPTKGYLSSSFGPLAEPFKAMAGNPVVNVLFMAGLFGVGVSLTFGVAVRLGGWSGVAMVLMMYASHPAIWAEPHGTHPFLDDHIVQACALALLALTPSGDTWGLGTRWRARTSKVKWLW